jgi:ArsR family transcriptional regulator, virulence genes transcriptional regulator
MNLIQLKQQSGVAERFLKALANRHRLLILCELHQGELSVTALQQRIGLSQSALSQHLARLREDSLVSTRRHSQTIYYSLANQDVIKMISLLHELFCAQACASGSPKRRRKAAA